jgi:hypothetical protein
MTKSAKQEVKKGSSYRKNKKKKIYKRTRKHSEKIKIKIRKRMQNFHTLKKQQVNLKIVQKN